MDELRTLLTDFDVVSVLGVEQQPPYLDQSTSQTERANRKAIEESCAILSGRCNEDSDDNRSPKEYVDVFRSIMSEDSLSRFKSFVQPFLADWKSIDLRVLAYRGSDERWDFYTILAVLDHGSPSTPTRTDLPKPKDLLVAHERWSIDRLDDLLTAVSQGELTVGGQTVRITRFDGQGRHPVFAQYPALWNRQSSRVDFGIDFASFITRIYEALQPATLKSQDLHKTIEDELRGSDPPWDGLSDLRQNFVGLRGTQPWGMTSCNLDIIAPLGARIDFPIVKNGRGTFIAIEDEIPLTQTVRLSFIGQRDDGSFHRSLLEPRRTKTQFGVTVDLDALPSRTTVIVTYGGVEVDRTNLTRSENPRLNAFLEFMAESDPERINSRILATRGLEFESYLTILLQLLGFSPAHYGGTKLGAPDIIAFPPEENWLLLLECTGSEPDVGNKLSRLATRAKATEGILVGHTVHSVMVTTISRKMLNHTDLEKAKKERISIVTSNEFESLLDFAIDDAKPAKLRDYLLTLIPEV